MRRLALAFSLLAALATGCGGGGAVGDGKVTDVVTPPGTNVPTTTTTPAPTGGSTTTTPTTTPAAQRMTFQVWLARGETLWPVMRTAPKSPAVATAAMSALLAGPTAVERRHGVVSIVPRGTKLLGITIDHGTATVDLSSEYASGGGSLSMTLRLAQVVYTVTQFPTVKRVAFELDGKPVTVFSGEGIVLDRPQTRHDYEQALPVIAVAQPGFGQTVTSPVTVSGLANVFEANVTIELRDASGKVLARSVVTATCGTGCWGTFTHDLAFHVTSRQAGTVIVHDDDAAGTGTFPHVVRIPVVLTP
jgi:sporulation and spore germination protein/immunoglobulin-like protein involved in spore germination